MSSGFKLGDIADHVSKTKRPSNIEDLGTFDVDISR
jgi:hypothetical protein